MHTRIETLEIAHGYLQKTVDDLNAVVTDQQREIQELRRVVQLLAEKFQELSAPAPTITAANEKPPHY